MKNSFSSLIAAILLTLVLAACGVSSSIAGTYSGNQVVTNSNSNAPDTTFMTVNISKVNEGLYDVTLTPSQGFPLSSRCQFANSALSCSFDVLGLSTVDYSGTASNSVWSGAISGGNATAGFVSGSFTFRK